MKRKGKIIGSILFIIIIVAFWSYRTKINNSFEKGLLVVKWNNWYEGNNIKYYYDDALNAKIQNLKNKNKLEKVVENSKDELDKALKLSKWLKDKVKFNKTSMKLNEDPANIIEKALKGTPICDRDYTLLYSKLAESIDLKIRRGEFRQSGEKSTQDIYYEVCEIWSNKYNKWIMIDVIKNTYMKDKEPLSACEVMDKEINNIEIQGNTYKKYKNDIQKYLYSYTIAIDNSIYKVKESNSYITYIKKGNTPRLQYEGQYINPTIFVNKQDMFKISPNINFQNLNNDEKATIVLSNKSSEKKETNKSKEQVFIVGAFKNSEMLNNYYIKINDSKWKKIDSYFDLKIPQDSEIKLSLSEDGKNISREIVLKYIKH